MQPCVDVRLGECTLSVVHVTTVSRTFHCPKWKLSPLNTVIPPSPWHHRLLSVSINLMTRDSRKWSYTGFVRLCLACVTENNVLQAPPCSMCEDSVFKAECYPVCRWAPLSLLAHPTMDTGCCYLLAVVTMCP